MKKSILILTIPLLLGCSSSENQIKILCPTGAPSIAFYKYATNPVFETNSDPTNIVGMMNKTSSKNIVIIDTTSGIQAIHNGAPYKIAATITFGNFFLCSTGNDENNTLDSGDKVILFGKNKTPDLLFHYLYGEQYNSSITYVNSAADAASVLQTGKYNTINYDYVFLAQPGVYTSLLKNTNASIYDNIQESYQAKSGLNLIQASIFVRNYLSKGTIDTFLENIKTDIEDAINNPSIVEDTITGLIPNAAEQINKFQVKASIAKTVLENNNGLGLGYKKSYEIKNDIDQFIALFGASSTNEKDFYK